MPILDLQRRMVELGRIRTGDQVEFQDQAGKTKRRPRKLETFRLTSQRADLIAEAARLYGGEVRPWNDQWEVTIAAETLPVMLPPGEAVSQYLEMWSGGGCARRCDGRVEVLSDHPCMCPADPAERAQLASKGEACKPTTRVNLILHELPGLGVWRLESHGYYAAVELAGAAEYLSMATSVGHRIPAHLRIVKRTVKRQVNGKPQTRNFTVPTIDIDVRPLDLLTGGGAVEIAAPIDRALPAGPVNRRQRVERPALPAGQALPDQANLERPDRPPMGEPPDFPEDASFTPGAARQQEAPGRAEAPAPAIHTPEPPSVAATPVAATDAGSQEVVEAEYAELPGFEANPAPRLTREAFVRLSRQEAVRRGMSAPQRNDWIAEKAHEILPDKSSEALVDEDWGRLAVALGLPIGPAAQEA